MRSSSFPLRALLRSLVLAAGPLACGGASPTEMSHTVPCAALNDPARYALLRQAPEVDGIAFFTRTVANGSGAVGPGAVLPAPTTAGVIGSPCARATVRETCLANVEAASTAGGWTIRDASGWQLQDPKVLRDYGVVTRGDEVRIIESVEELRAAVAPIDSLEEAAALARIGGVALSCDQANARHEPDGYLFKRFSSSCSGESSETLTKMTRDGRISVARRELTDADTNCIEGRRPAGLASRTEPWLASLPAHFAEIAHMEAAAVIAFEQLERELAAVNAPSGLHARIASARLDEIDHAARMTDLARGLGKEPARPEVIVSAHRVPSVFELALENATEGCVREAYGALVAMHQASFASDPRARAAFERIAEDEATHAELSYDLADWLASMLSRREIAQITQAQDAAWNELAAACAVEPAAEVVRLAGMPTAAGARAMLEGLRAQAPRFGTTLRAA